MEVKKRRGKEIKPREEGDMAIYGALVFDHGMAWPCSCPCSPTCIPTIHLFRLFLPAPITPLSECGVAPRAFLHLAPVPSQ